MKTKIYIQAILIAVVVAIGQGCARERSAETPAPAPTTQDPTTPTTPSSKNPDTNFQSGALATLNIDSLAAINSYVQTHPVNNPSDIKVSVKLVGNAGKYTGQVFISYYDNGQYYTGRFYAHNQTVPAGVSHGHTGKSYGEYNQWFTWGGDSVFHGFFQDSYGAVMLVINGGIDLGDGAGVSSLTGEIWFKNFYTTPAPQGAIPCWFIELGPYDCRTFLTNGETVSTTSALYPDESVYYTSSSTNPAIPAEPARGWRRLGTFSGMDKTKAFN